MSSSPLSDAVERALALAYEPNAPHVFISLFEQQAREHAHAMDANPSHGYAAPLWGMPITVKDNFDMAGLPTTAGSRLLREAAVAHEDAIVVQRLKNAGAIILGRTNMTEFAFSGLGLNPHYGTPVNPAFTHERRIPGGSSSGAAVSVARGIVPVAVGTDTGGSVRIPAAFCGLVGFKPTANTISRDGVLPLSPTLDSVGIIGRNVADCTGVFDVIRDRPGPARFERPPHRYRLGVVENYVTGGVTDEVRAGVGRALSALERGGVSLEPIVLPELDEIPDMTRAAGFSPVESYAWHAPFLKDRESEYDPRVLVRILAGAAMSGPAYFALLARRATLIRLVAQRMAGFDALIWPTVPIVAPAFASLESDKAYHDANGLVLRNPTVVNLFDGCAVSLPCPVDGAPVGLTLAARGGLDDHLLCVAACAEKLLKG
jgi:aspartyl-tRNA(Asn)/glutamyl-tRNA(Gln) amidotransferase subunit A